MKGEKVVTFLHSFYFALKKFSLIELLKIIRRKKYFYLLVEFVVCYSGLVTIYSLHFYLNTFIP